jgi:hypothetical protein
MITQTSYSVDNSKVGIEGAKKAFSTLGIEKHFAFC